MTLAGAVGESAARAVAVALVARALAPSLAGALQGSRAWLLLVALVLAVPPLALAAGLDGLPGNAPAAVELRYLLVLVLRLAPLGALVLLAVPVHDRAALQQLRRLGARLPWRQALALRWRAAWRREVACLALPALLAFGEFELASIWVRESWAVLLFDAQVGGTPLGATLALVLPIALLQLLVVLPLLLGLLRSSAGASLAPAPAWPRRCWAVAAVAVLVLLPLLRLLTTARWGGFPLLAELRDSLVLALAASCCAVVLVLAWRRLPDRWRGMVGGVLLLPGLCGSLVLGLLLLPLQSPAAGVLPWLLALVLLALPLALPVQAALGGAGAAARRQLALLPAIEARRLARRQLLRPASLLGAVLLLWSLQDLPASSLLAPAAHPPIQVRLANFLHYGRDGAVASWTLLLWSLPLLLVAATLAAVWMATSLRRWRTS